MGGNSDEKEVEVSYLSRFCNIGYRILDFVTLGSLSKRDARISRLEGFIDYSEEERSKLSGRVISLNSAHKRERREWERRKGTLEAQNEALDFGLVEASNEIVGLEGRLKRVEGSMRYYWANAHDQFQEALKGLKDFYVKAGMEVDEETLAKSVGYTMQKLGVAVKEADAKLDKAREIREKGILAYALMELDDSKPVIVVGINNVVEAASKTAQKLMGKKLVGEYADSVCDGLAAMVGYVAETHEEGFDLYSIGGLRNRIGRVKVRRLENTNEYIGATITIEEKRIFDFLQRERDPIREAVNKAVMLGDVSVPFVINLTRLRDVPQDIGRRLYGLGRSDYFRKRLSVRVDSAEVYSALERYGVPHEMMDYAGEFKAPTEKGLKGALPEKA